ncbi:MAG: hypothetical protein RLZZ123_799 [Pseudomonadota bacterium]|jgi:flagella basal body P-ring formation protein FlgA
MIWLVSCLVGFELTKFLQFHTDQQKMSQLFILFALWISPLLAWSTDASGMPKGALESGVTAWVAKQQGLDVAQISMIPIDHRLNLKNCESDLKYSFPFNNNETVKVVCPQPSWQIFVRLILPNAGARGGTAASALTGVASNGRSNRQVWVVEQHLSTGSVVQKRQLSLVDRDTQSVGQAALDAQADLSYMEAVRDLTPGTIIRQHDLRPMILVKRGQMVQMTLGQGQGFQIAARVEAMQDGRFGEQIKLKNPESGRILSGVVKGPGTVTGS